MPKHKISKEEFLAELEDATRKMAEGFETIMYLVQQNMEHGQQRDYLNPETLGPISAFLQCGNGFEAAFSQGRTIEDLQAFAEHELDSEDEEDEDEEEEEEDDDT